MFVVQVRCGDRGYKELWAIRVGAGIRHAEQPLSVVLGGETEQ